MEVSKVWDTTNAALCNFCSGISRVTELGFRTRVGGKWWGRALPEILEIGWYRISQFLRYQLGHISIAI